MNIPKIRFKEFRNEWHSCKIDDFCKILMCKRIFANETSQDYEIPFYKIGTIGGTPDTFISKKLFDIYKIKYNYPKKGELLVTCSGTVGKCIIFDGKDSYYQDSNIVWLDNLTLKVSNRFLYYLLSRVDWSKLNSTTITRIYSNDLKQLKINYPEKEEQNKITNLLELLDKKIELQTKKIEALKLFKLSIKKKIFQTNINTEIKLNQLVKCESSSLTLSDIQNIDGPFPVYGAEGFIKNINFYNHNNEYIAIVKDGAGVGRTMICPSKSSTISTMNALIPILEYKATYILELLNLINFKKYIIGSGIPHIYFKDYGKEKIKIHSIDKSNKITKLFDLLNKRINYTQNHVEHLKKLKQGLLQIMFI